MLVGVPSLADNDRFASYRQTVLNCVRVALRGVDYSVLLSPPQHAQGLSGVVDAQNSLIEECLSRGFDFLWLVQADVQVPEDAFEKLLASALTWLWA